MRAGAILLSSACAVAGCGGGSDGDQQSGPTLGDVRVCLEAAGMDTSLSSSTGTAATSELGVSGERVFAGIDEYPSEEAAAAAAQPSSELSEEVGFSGELGDVETEIEAVGRFVVHNRANLAPRAGPEAEQEVAAGLETVVGCVQSEPSEADG